METLLNFFNQVENFEARMIITHSIVVHSTFQEFSFSSYIDINSWNEHLDSTEMREIS